MSKSGRPPRSGAFFGLSAPLFYLRSPFVALARRTAPLHFNTTGGRTFYLTVSTTPTAGGLPIHTDADILIVATTLLVRALNAGEPLPNPITLTPLQLLRALGRPVGGAQRAQVDAALMRLTNASVSTDLWPAGGTLFSLIERVERPDGPRGPYELHLPEFLLEEVRHQRIRPFAPAALRLHGLERCLYGWACAYAGGKAYDSWRIELRSAHERACAPPPYADPRRRGAALRQFKAALRQIAQADRLPGFRMKLVTEVKGTSLLLTRSSDASACTQLQRAEKAAPDLSPSLTNFPALAAEHDVGPDDFALDLDD